MATWQADEAQARFREVTDNGAGVIVLSEDEYRLLIERKPTFKEHLLSGPKVDDFTIERTSSFVSFLIDGPRVEDFTIERDPDTGRDCER